MIEADGTPKWVSIPPILNAVFQFLPARDLCRCSQVCKEWHSMVEVVKHHRIGKISWCYLLDDDCGGSCEATFAEFVNNMFAKPRLVLIFGDDSKFRRKRKRKGARAVPSFSACFGHHLPASCESFICNSDSVIGTTSDCSLTCLLANRRGLTAVFFPYIPGFEIHAFEINPKFSLHDCADIPTDKQIKGVLIFRCYKDSSLEREMEMELALINLLSQSQGIRAMGCVEVARTILSTDFRLGYCSFGIAFTGENVLTASIAISEDVIDASEVSILFQNFFDAHMFDGQIIAFVFAASDKEWCHKEAINVFRNLFPAIPLFGLFGNNLFGTNYFVDSHGNNITIQDGMNVYRSAQIFVIVSVQN